MTTPVLKGGKMSILNSSYEISVWLDKLDNNGVFKEERVCVIGSDTMLF
jgi:hypothetical protein